MPDSDSAPPVRRSVRLGITLGDPTGIGPEVVAGAIQSLASEPGCQYVLIGDLGVIERAFRARGLPSPRTLSGADSLFLETVAAVEPPGPALFADLPVGGDEAARAAVGWLRFGGEACIQGQLDGVVTGPVSKESILRSGIPFIGQTEFLSGLAQCQRSGMMLLGPDDRGRWLRVLLATTHLPLRDVASSLSVSGLETSIDLAVEACRLLDLSRSRIAVCGLNPHAGEGGRLGREELDVIQPAVDRARSRGIDVVGPVSADTLFFRVHQGEFDVVIAMYHDQGLVPLKMVAFDSGVNWTVGLPFVRTSPDHGTAFDIAGRGMANPASMIAAIRLARRLLRNNP